MTNSTRVNSKCPYHQIWSAFSWWGYSIYHNLGSGSTCFWLADDESLSFHCRTLNSCISSYGSDGQQIFAQRSYVWKQWSMTTAGREWPNSHLRRQGYVLIITITISTSANRSVSPPSVWWHIDAYEIGYNWLRWLFVTLRKNSFAVYQCVTIPVAVPYMHGDQTWSLPSYLLI